MQSLKKTTVMSEELEMLQMETEEKMEKALQHYRDELLTIRAGKASPEMLSGLHVEAYGALSPLNSVAGVSAPDARSIVIQPFDKSVIQDIEKSIINSSLGFNPQNDGNVIRINIPPLTEERRTQLVKMAKNELENARVAIRTARKDAMEGIKKLVKDGLSEDIGKDAEEEVQQLTNASNKKAEDLLARKEQDIMTV